MDDKYKYGIDYTPRDKKQALINRLLTQGHITQADARLLLGPDTGLNNTFHTTINPVSQENIEDWNKRLSEAFKVLQNVTLPTAKPTLGLSVNGQITGTFAPLPTKFERGTLKGDFKVVPLTVDNSHVVPLTVDGDLIDHHYPYVDTAKMPANKQVEDND